jgi:hypothetical protein
MINLGNPTIQSGQAYVIVIDKRDDAQPCPGQECAIDTALENRADVFLCPDYNISYAMYFNGNDAVSLQKTTNGGTTWNYVDIFGMMGDPAMVSGVAWSDAFPYDGTAGTWWTINHTLVRKSAIQQGVTANPSPQFIVTTQWDSLPENTYSGLGTHTCSCPIGTSSINDIDNSVAVKVFPNPARPDFQGPITIQGIRYNSDVKITDVAGNLVYKTTSNGGTATWDGKTLTGERVTSGVYLIWSAANEGKGRKVGKVVVIN